MEAPSSRSPGLRLGLFPDQAMPAPSGGRGVGLECKKRLKLLPQAVKFEVVEEVKRRFHAPKLSCN